MTDFTLGPGPLTPEFEQVKSDIGIVENGNTATHAIPAGYYVIWKGDLYVAKTDISSGTALSAASGGNLTAKTQGIGAEVSALKSNASQKRENLPVISSDTAIMDLLPGTYQNILGYEVMPYLPSGYGVLVVNDSGIAYKSYFYTSTDNITWYRICHKNDRTWYGDWQKIALNSDLSTKLSYARVLDISASNINSYMTTGVYQAWMANDLQSGVGNAWGILIVLHGTSVVCEQIMITVNGISVRHYESGTWGNWRKVSFSLV